ncbi:MAG: hypothetical protein ACK4VJ_05275 [Rhodoluna sp.]|jgi:hypothetical protein
MKILEQIRNDSGDVPGWVLVTLMTAGLVVLLWAVAGPALKTIFNNAVSKVIVI